jgi:hypothetical protein
MVDGLHRLNGLRILSRTQAAAGNPGELRAQAEILPPAVPGTVDTGSLGPLARSALESMRPGLATRFASLPDAPSAALAWSQGASAEEDAWSAAFSPTFTPDAVYDAARDSVLFADGFARLVRHLGVLAHDFPLARALAPLRDRPAVWLEDFPATLVALARAVANLGPARRTATEQRGAREEAARQRARVEAQKRANQRAADAAAKAAAEDAKAKKKPAAAPAKTSPRTAAAALPDAPIDPAELQLLADQFVRELGPLPPPPPPLDPSASDAALLADFLAHYLPK